MGKLKCYGFVIICNMILASLFSDQIISDVGWTGYIVILFISTLALSVFYTQIIEKDFDLPPDDKNQRS